MTESIYASYSKDEIDELFSNFLINSWSYSKVSSFARNEKAFEMNYIFGLHSRNSATTIAGQAYHDALQVYFNKKKIGGDIDLIGLEAAAFAIIDETPANMWKLQKTTPTIEESKEKALKTVSALLKNFMTEKGTYEDELAEVLAVEFYCNEFITINGVDIPLPCHAIIDLVIKTVDGRIVVVDHKSKASFTGDDEMALSIGIQAITYVKCYEAKTGQTVDEVWFVENKFSQNKDKSPQLQNSKIPIDDDTRSLYEALLYEPLKKMVSAVSDPDYTYLINDSDNFVDRAQLYDFWARTMIAEVGEFNVEEDKKEMVSKRLKKIRDASINVINPKVIKNFKENASKFIQYDLSSTNMTAQEKIEHVLRSFGTIVKVAHKFDGYSSDTYLLEASAGVKISSIYSHRLDLANALDVSNVRLSQQLVVHDGRSYVAVEVLKKRERDLFFDAAELRDMKIPLGKDNLENTIVWDLANQSTPHMLVCGATGSGKTVLILSIIAYAKLAGVTDIVIFDPKYEFTAVHDLNCAGISIYNDIVEVEVKMMELVEEMNERVRLGLKKYTLVIFDEFADAVSKARSGKELEIKEMVQVGTYAPKKDAMGFMSKPQPKMALQTVGEYKSLEENLKILLQKGRSSGYRIIAATQRASVKVITGDAKTNLPVQICFRVPKETDSRVVIDEAGAEALAGRGDGLIKSPEYNNIVRFQSYYKK
jgi:hypothetical protein